MMLVVLNEMSQEEEKKRRVDVFVFQLNCELHSATDQMLLQHAMTKMLASRAMLKPARLLLLLLLRLKLRRLLSRVKDELKQTGLSHRLL
jgi:hypothetical protein